MKKPKKHTFRHVDPEMVATEPKNQTKISKQRPELSYAEKDLRRIGLLIAGFVLSVVILYFAQTKTGLLTPVLRLFGI